MSNRSVGVYNEWDELTHALVGSSDTLIYPDKTSWIARAYRPELSEQIEPYAGFSLDDTDGELASLFRQQGNALASLFSAEGIALSKHRSPTSGEAAYNDRAEISGFFNFWARDPLIAVGPYLISSFCRMPLRMKELWTQFEAVEAHCEQTGQLHIGLPMPRSNGERRGDDQPFLEGGDVFIMSDHILVGHSGIASTLSGIHWLRRLVAPLGIEVHCVELEPWSKGRWMHLDCVFATPREGLAMLVPEAIKGGIRGLPKFMQDWEFLSANEAEAHAMGCNLINVAPNRSVIGAEHHRIIERLDDHGVELLTLPYDLPSTFGGGPRCSVQPLIRRAADERRA